MILSPDISSISDEEEIKERRVEIPHEILVLAPVNHVSNPQTKKR
jgi:hypothetical protein